MEHLSGTFTYLPSLEVRVSHGGYHSFRHLRAALPGRSRAHGHLRLSDPGNFEESFGGTRNQWEFQDPKMEVPTIYKAYVRPM